MADNSLQLTLREMRRMFVSPQALAILATVALAAGVSGPFGTFEDLPTPQRMAYWAVMCVLTFGSGAFASVWISQVFLRRTFSVWLAVPINALVASLPVVPIIMAINYVAFGHVNFDRYSLGVIFVYALVVAFVVTALFAIINRPGRATADAAGPRILERLNVTQRGVLISLSVQDHYVEVSTSRSKTLLLMRLSDAIAETSGVAGVQIHRSHWVALDGVSAVRRKSGKVVVETRSGDMFPVSRSFMAAAKAAGLIG